jgi:hypothetical protein
MDVTKERGGWVSVSWAVRYHRVFDAEKCFGFERNVVHSKRRAVVDICILFGSGHSSVG